MRGRYVEFCWFVLFVILRVEFRRYFILDIPSDYCSMIRRSPTRIVLKLNDLKEYETLKKEMEVKKDTSSHNTWEGAGKTKQDIVRERIGYVPQPHES
ncbi:hypothetical protein ONE63_003186 [Megalurothrips usitatus]|uniref:Anaphase-promoting complex subunit CDC26 n=1 Tax=Megalurothrips usitatus TaxID=439358 RepID=A0AAV7X9G2_9NEOP|nr:hypothetical protein ONE63_003186 [Megalurothrips usitatus]